MPSLPAAPAACPACQSSATVAGQIAAPAASEDVSTAFYPKGLKFWTLRRSVRLTEGQRFQACTGCGHVWARLDPTHLQQLLQRSRA